MPRVRYWLPKCFAVWALLSVLSSLCAAASHAQKPKVRAITAFVHLDRAHYADQVKEALTVLRQAKSAFEQAGYDVQSIRITTQPFPEYILGLSPEETLNFFREYEALVQKEHFSASIGPAMLSDSDNPKVAELLGDILRTTTNLDSSIIVAGEDGIHWNAVRAAAKLMKYVSANTPHSEGNFNFAATAMLPPEGPFYPGSYHIGAGRGFAVGLQSANVVSEALATTADPAGARQILKSALSEHARNVEEIARRVEANSGWKYLGVDVSPAPDKDVSIGTAVENFTGAKFGSSGTLTAAALITSVLRELPVKHAGYSGLMLPILEDSILAERWSEGKITIDDLLAYSSVCSTGLDTIPLPGDTSQKQLEQIIGDMASLAVKWHKPLAARLLPVAGKREGDRTEFKNSSLVNATLQPLP